VRTPVAINRWAAERHVISKRKLMSRVSGALTPVDSVFFTATANLDFPMTVRPAPVSERKLPGLVINPGETIRVSHTFLEAERRQEWLKLDDGSGWVFVFHPSSGKPLFTSG
jgi:hypothetical protein